MNAKMKALGALFVALFVFLLVKPHYVYSIYSTILGRIVLLGILIFIAKKNITLGLLVALIIITAMNQYGSFSEGMTNPNTKPESEESNISQDGVDKESVKNSIMPKNSKSIPVEKSVSTEVSPSSVTDLGSKESFISYAPF
jgi:hypothetical protein